MFSLLHSSTIFVFASRRPLIRTVSMASNNIKHLRTQLNQLHTEADNTRDKANNARMRLLRLSEAAEKLQRQAAVDVQNGKENEARELLFQKKKVMQALEKSKRRVELLDEFLTKLNENVGDNFPYNQLNPVWLFELPNFGPPFFIYKVLIKMACGGFLKGMERMASYSYWDNHCEIRLLHPYRVKMKELWIRLCLGISAKVSDTVIRVGGDRVNGDLGIGHWGRCLSNLKKQNTYQFWPSEVWPSPAPAIFVIETQLVGTVALGLEFAGKDAPTTVRIISPAEDVSDEVLEWEDSAPSTTQNDKDEVRFNEESKDNLDISHQQKDIEGQKRTTMGIRDEDDLISSLMSISSYDDLLDHLDQQLRKIELEFVTVLSLSTLVLESEEKPKNSKVQQILEILEHVRSIRGRIASVMMKVKDVN
ncbi:hypothetical protein GIB67_034851 [Kingdonia uniflora]|uniref:Uncharacterized protein n=1 Tax=Kingdonia uniflora TaxID=39325 RepID=A0A7J7MDY0_9MAGN|nr:hypothetical protein GIB67_034851 [Kingdonia uniflora]